MSGDSKVRSTEPAPPWIALPDLSPDGPGPAEAYVAVTFLPFWTQLTAAEKAGYLDRWNASPEWRSAIAFKYDHEGFDIEADAPDSEARRAAHPLTKPGKPWWAFWRT